MACISVQRVAFMWFCILYDFLKIPGLYAVPVWYILHVLFVGVLCVRCVSPVSPSL